MSKEAIQTGPHALGYSPGPIDGINGPKTRGAALEFGKGAPAKPAAGVVTPSAVTMIYQGSAKHPVREIIVHCSTTRPDWLAGRDQSRRRLPKSAAGTLRTAGKISVITGSSIAMARFWPGARKR